MCACSLLRTSVLSQSIARLLPAWLLISAVAPAAEPQPIGWPLIEEERAYVLRPEHERRPGSDTKVHQPALWPVTPSAGHWGGTRWLDAHSKLVEHVQANRGPVDILLVGDSLTQQWGSVLEGRPLNAAWQRHFSRYQTINLGIAGDKTQNVLWRLHHGGVAGLEPRLVVLLIGNNNMFFARETGVEAVAQGIKACVDALRVKFPNAPLILFTILPAHSPGHAFYEDIKRTNAALHALKLGRDPRVQVLDLWGEMTETDGMLKPGLFQGDTIHLAQEAGYEFLAAKLQPLVTRLLLP